MGNKQSKGNDPVKDFIKAQKPVEKPSGKGDEFYNEGVKSKDDEKRVQRFERAANEYRLERKYVRAAECSRLAAYSYDFVGAKQDYAEKLSEAVRMYARAGTMTALQSAFAILSEELEKALLNAGLGAKNFDAAAAGAVDGALEGYQEGHITAAEFVDLIPTIQDAAPGRMKAQVTAKIVDVLIGQGDYKEAAAQFKELVSAQVLDIDSRDEAIIINCAKGFLCVTAVLARSDNDADFVPAAAAQAQAPNPRKWAGECALRAACWEVHEAARCVDWTGLDASIEALLFTTNTDPTLKKLCGAVRAGVQEAEKRGKKPIERDTAPTDVDAAAAQLE